MNYKIDENGYYGEFGGAYTPEILHSVLQELTEAFTEIKSDASFIEEYNDLLVNYVGRPSPLYYAKRLSARYKTNIYLKREDTNHTGAHKINNALGQILLAKRMQKTQIIAETGAGQHGVATATACALMGMGCTVFMGKTDVERQFLNVQKMRMLGAKIVPVESGNSTLKDATNEAIRHWCSHPKSYYIIGSTVGPHPYPEMVGFFQSVIGEEIKQQLQQQLGRDYPDRLIACIGGGSNAMGTYSPFLNDQRVRIISAEAGGLGVHTLHNAATLHNGTKGIIHGSMTLLMQDEDGQITEPYSISAGLDYPGIGPAHAYFAKIGRTKVYAISDDEALEAALELTQLEGIIPAIESAHALAILKKEQANFSPDHIVVLTVSGRGDKDMETYVKFFKGASIN